MLFVLSNFYNEYTIFIKKLITLSVAFNKIICHFYFILLSTHVVLIVYNHLNYGKNGDTDVNNFEIKYILLTKFDKKNIIWKSLTLNKCIYTDNKVH